MAHRGVIPSSAAASSTPPSLLSSVYPPLSSPIVSPLLLSHTPAWSPSSHAHAVTRLWLGDTLTHPLLPWLLRLASPPLVVHRPVSRGYSPGLVLASRITLSMHSAPFSLIPVLVFSLLLLLSVRFVPDARFATPLQQQTESNPRAYLNISGLGSSERSNACCELRMMSNEVAQRG